MRTRPLLVSAAVASALVAGCSGAEGPEADPEPTTQAPPSEHLAAAELLEEAGYLEPDGAVAFGPAGPGDDETAVQEALCTYLFGSPDTVAERAGLDEAVLAEGSGFQNLGANGSGIRCGWGAPDRPVLALVVWGEESEWISEGAEEFDLVVDLPSGVGVAFYDPESDVERLPPEDLEAWLRVAPAVTQSV